MQLTILTPAGPYGRAQLALLQLLWYGTLTCYCPRHSLDLQHVNAAFMARVLCKLHNLQADTQQRQGQHRVSVYAVYGGLIPPLTDRTTTAALTP